MPGLISLMQPPIEKGLVQLAHPGGGAQNVVRSTWQQPEKEREGGRGGERKRGRGTETEMEGEKREEMDRERGRERGGRRGGRERRGEGERGSAAAVAFTTQRVSTSRIPVYRSCPG